MYNPIISGCDAMVAYQLPKLEVAGSSPVSRSIEDEVTT